MLMFMSQCLGFLLANARSGRRKVMVQLLGSLPATWETWSEYQLLDSAQAGDHCRHFGSEPVLGVLSASFSASLRNTVI